MAFFKAFSKHMVFNAACVLVFFSAGCGSDSSGDGSVLSGVTPFTGTKLAFTTLPAKGTTSQNLGTITVAVQDAGGMTVPGATTPVTLKIGNNAGAATIGGTLTRNAVNGIATFSDIQLNKPGTGYTLDASATGLAGALSNGFRMGVTSNFAAPLVLTLDGGNGGGTSPQEAAVGDVNGDGKADIIVSNVSSNNLSIYSGNGNGTFGAEILLATNASGPVVPVVADFNGDGKPDIAVATGGQLCFYPGSNSLNFPTRVDTGTGNAGSAVRGMAKLDVDGDGDLDLAVADFGDNSVKIFLNNGAGVFSVQTYLSGNTLSGARSLVVGDWNGDGKPDLAIASFSAGQGCYTWINSGVAASFFPVANLKNNLTASSNSGASTGIAAGDLNGDGRADLVALYTDGNNPRARPYVSQGNGTFTAGTSVFCSQDPFSAAISDIDGDGLADLISVSPFGLNFVNPGEANVLLSNGDGTLQSQLIFKGSAGHAPRSVAAGDFNGDGKIDVLTVGSEANVFINNGQ